jgi:hypothetical protein
MSKAFVGKRSLTSSDELKKLLETLPSTSRCYFLRWIHKVSGFVDQIPNDFPSPEGEMLTPEFEVRWKQTRQGYEMLLLQSGEPDPDWKFETIGKDWISSNPLAVYLHPNGKLEDSDRQDTRYPKLFIYPNDLNLQQRYFQNQHTGTIHFVALTLAKSEVKAS